MEAPTQLESDDGRRLVTPLPLVAAQKTNGWFDMLAARESATGSGLLAIVTSASSQGVTPYTVTEVSREFDAAGKVISESRFLFAVNRDGSIVSVDLDTAVGGSQILDVVNGRNIVVNPKARSLRGAIRSRRRASRRVDQQIGGKHSRARCRNGDLREPRRKLTRALSRAIARMPGNECRDAT